MTALAAPDLSRPTPSFQVNATSDATVLDVAGELDLNVTDRLADCLGSELALGPPALIVDAADVTFCAVRALAISRH
ncbi:hypothetical protein GCM10027598_48250 [Amycolatopsis oliviviridis]|uniref:STAS domain-containing protein n=1 Tax=Amycolatopsis oliviviridis TaxID=1471590 RepID=A0ABQ3MBZ5_9PSEU|nr:hypothetical protein [Amycolatopsis oliviviridis]GHH37946.1 hypothetical protein GCM10017790_83090 [Amycolatopsis oliviviridis]